MLITMSCKGGCPGGSGESAGTTEQPPPPPPPPPPTADGADDTAGVPTPICLNTPVEGQSRARLQCSGELEARLALNVTVSGISVDQDPVAINKEFGQGQAGDDYSDPLVMACCAEVTDPFCGSDASQSCTLDLIQTSCQSLPARIAEKADEQTLPGPKEALQNLSAWIGGNQEACRSAFGASEVETTAPTCETGNTSGYSAVLAGRQWEIPGTFSGGTTDISNVVITVGKASITGVHPADLGTASGCWSLEDNDSAPHFLEIFPTGPLVEST